MRHAGCVLTLILPLIIILIPPTPRLVENDQEIRSLSNSKLHESLNQTEFIKRKLQPMNQRQDNETGLISSSDDDFELPKPISLKSESSTLQTQEEEAGGHRRILDWNERLVRAKIKKLEAKSMQGVYQGRNRAVFRDKNLYFAMVNKSQSSQQFQRINDNIRITQQTPNRILDNYHEYIDPQQINATGFSYQNSFLSEEDIQSTKLILQTMRLFLRKVLQSKPRLQDQIKNYQDSLVDTEKLKDLTGYQKLKNKVQGFKVNKMLKQ